MTSPLQHTTVLLNEAVDSLLGGAGPEPSGTWVDATFGRGGHSRLILLRPVSYTHLTLPTTPYV